MYSAIYMYIKIIQDLSKNHVRGEREDDENLKATNPSTD
jgi:hypothetical protein